MNTAGAPIAVALLLQCGLGLAVFLANPKRKSNQWFLVLCLIIGAWLISLFLAFSATTEAGAEMTIRLAWSAGALILAGFNLMRLSIRENDRSWGVILRHSRVWLIGTAAIIVLCQTKLLLQGARLPAEVHLAAPTPIYGPAIKLYAIYFLGGISFLMIATWRDLRQTGGAERAELAFLLVGGLTPLFLSVPLALLLGKFFEPS